MVVDWKSEMKKETIAQLGELEITTKAIVIIAGYSESGKTASCLALTADAIKRGYKVLYCNDDAGKRVIDRAEPNLFQHLYNENKKGFDRLFLYEKELKENELVETLKKEKPDLLIIDSVYEPFIHIENPKSRAKAIRTLLTNLRSIIVENNIALVATTKVGRVRYPDGTESEEMLGGEGIKYVSDVKVMIQMPENQKKGDGHVIGKRCLIIDTLNQYVFNIDGKGMMTTK